jgi:probable phosphoglycerate mutase
LAAKAARVTYPELYILRHGETVWNAENRMQGWLNSPLTPKGEMHAARQGEILRACDLGGLTAWSSPSGRAVQTAAIAVAPLLHDIHTDPRLREIGVGDWGGRLRDELPMPEGPDGFVAQYDLAPNGEGLAALEARCRDFLAGLQGPAVLVTHGITSRMIRACLLGPDAVSAAAVHGGQGCVYHIKDGQQQLLT